MHHLKYFTLHTQDLDDHENINQQLIEGLNSHIDKESTRKSHHFFGRYENIYIDKNEIPCISEILKYAKIYSAETLIFYTAALLQTLLLEKSSPIILNIVTTGELDERFSVKLIAHKWKPVLTGTWPIWQPTL